ncbi:TrkH family potassium uptake protein [Thiothrix lacustris]|uniref:TrkH family potassium uptake protein n=1 Tax=Thiothrix lacustris TaxID=525917 RepID=A0ABY9MP97_9GAMM|nr:TrkH family potassium uptake protein [Thiothrix lacustris]WML90066.1 TrkH family potassium uptake protein [Thiothrix lacustris]
MFIWLRSLAFRRTINLPPPALLALSYAILIVIGMLALELPVSTHHGIAWGDALFTAVSAVTVTGLGVVDTGSAFTTTGQAFILLLIQLGGLGIMVFAVLILSAMGLPIGMSHHVFLREDLNQTSVRELVRLLKVILWVVLVCELGGTALLACVTVPEFGWQTGLWQALFHSISAFNNAGFALFPDSMVRWANNPLVNFTIPMLVIIGGLGYSVIADIFQLRQWRRFSLHTKLMLVGTAVLLVGSTVLFAVLEWDNAKTLGSMASAFDKWQASWFQAVISRTAGFNSINLAEMHDNTTLMFISLMLIGGGSTSTAGGIKVTTFIILLLATLAFFRRQQRIHAFGRSVGLEQVLKVQALVVTTLLSVMFGVFLLTLTHDGEFLNLLFEAVSALATVGVSRGITGELDQLGRTIIMLLMFIGRVGPLTLGFFLAMQVPPRVRYPASQVYLG